MALLKDLLVTGSANIGGGVTSPTFTGDLIGNADSATKSIYDSGGSKTIRSYIASGSLSGTNILLKDADGGTVSTISIGGISITGNAATATKLGTSNVGDANTPIYLNAGTPTACTSLDLNTTGNAATATKATGDASGNTITSTYANSFGWNSTTTSDTIVKLVSKSGGNLSTLDLGARLLELTGGTMTGNLTIQNTNPYVKFIDTANSNYVSYVQGYDGKTFLGSTSAKSLCVDSSGNVSTPGNITATGTITGSLVYNAVWNDYAELFPRGEETEAGDIIALDEAAEEERYVKAVKGHKALVGVESNEYAHLIGGDANRAPEENLVDYIPVGLAGRVWVKVHDEPELGDYITASEIPGVGEATSSREQAIGIVVSKKQNGKVKIKII